MASSLAISLFIISAAAALLPMLASGNGGFSVDFIHRDSLKSPLHDPASTHSSRLRAAADRSLARAVYFRDAIRRSRSPAADIPADAAENFYSDIIPDSGSYIMSFYLGTPAKKILAIADTGSDLIWVQCKPCGECYKQKAPLFDPKASSSYKTIPCDSDSCSALPQSSCGDSNQCEYNYAYGDRSFVDGFLSSETIGFDSTGGRPVQIPKTLFGCTHRSGGTFNQDDAGLVGLGGGKLSLIRQLGSAIDGKFSYCLPSQSQTSATSKLNFGSNAVVSGSNAVTTPLIPGFPDTFYYLNLEQISVAGQAVAVGKSSDKLAVAEGNIIIDSGTTLTLIDDATLQSVESKVASSVSLPKVNDPNGIFSLCFDVSGAGNNAKFPDITFQFSGGAAVVLHQENAFMEAAENTVCLAIISSDIVGGINIFGNIAQQNFNIGYDLTAMKLTLAPTDCAKSS
ncbi:Aspartic proteinase CDR1 [Apostasia shenzhenica]|uniref:Aspartic proteinase CDR1 n=1 Tax=Apostasia shenzhenica TaxID=1088818 RepID=A0A2I0A3I1_9ASPA|nr:Aspartic proteinase CDR1 [Apostasia shenzhenica]